VSHYLVCELEAVCIDRPKDLLFKTTTADELYDIASLELDHTKLNLMAEAFAKAIMNTQKQKQFKDA
ncbi:hypothetical protein NAI50_10635, partial [Francisella tularensis subsp. holarctica]|nr:hypothetical protein [Francisella tularensis subsp. holarctica]